MRKCGKGDGNDRTVVRRKLKVMEKVERDGK